MLFSVSRCRGCLAAKHSPSIATANRPLCLVGVNSSTILNATYMQDTNNINIAALAMCVPRCRTDHTGVWVFSAYVSSHLPAQI